MLGHNQLHYVGKSSISGVVHVALAYLVPSFNAGSVHEQGSRKKAEVLPNHWTGISKMELCKKTIDI